jgi:23S rRNA (pseudouridine1915-N3)-methyltransferase
MLDIVIIAVDKVRAKYFYDASAEYLKRLSPYAKIKIEEIAPEAFRNEGDKNKAKKKEGERILKVINKYQGAEIICLTEKGKQMDSIKFSKWLDAKSNNKIVLVIAGALGFDEAVLNQATGELSLSALTFPHELARVVLFEQLYRAVCIAKGKEYHY